MAKRKRFRPRPGTATPAPNVAPPVRAVRTAGAGQADRPAGVGSPYWLFGIHAVAAALANPRRRLHRLLHTAEAADHHRGILESARQRRPHPPSVEPAERSTLDRLLPPGAVHQGLASQVEPLPPADLYGVCDDLREVERAVLVVLDQVTDPHNVGAILRSAAAFGAAAVVLTERHGARESGVLAKSASGALEHVPLVQVTNLSRAMATLKEAGFWCVGLAADAPQTLAAARTGGRVALLLGAEGSGLRRLTREHCDLLVRLPTRGPIGQLNVSNAAAVALYELGRDLPELPSTALAG